MKKFLSLLLCIVALAAVFPPAAPALNDAALTPLYSFDSPPLQPSHAHRQGDIVYFGQYEQDNNLRNGKEDIAWIILEIRDDKALILSKYILDAIPYHKTHQAITWEYCSLRQWLNNNFLATAFYDYESSNIVPVTIDNNDNQEYRVYGGNKTYDFIFLLSYDDAVNYFWANGDRRTTATMYAKDRGVYVAEDSGCSWWWLRSPGKTEDRAGNVVAKGTPSTFGGYVQSGQGGVRPALWVYLDALR